MVFDPEMPISIVDLGIVHDVRILDGPPHDPAGGARVEIDITPTFVGCPALEMIRSQIRQKVLEATRCREVQINFVYEPGWSVHRISPAGREQLRKFGVTVPTGQPTPPAHAGTPSDRCKPAVPPSGLVPLTITAAADLPVACPFCGATRTRMTSRFGPTRCKMIYYCDACRNSFEHLRAP